MKRSFIKALMLVLTLLSSACTAKNPALAASKTLEPGSVCSVDGDSTPCIEGYYCRRAPGECDVLDGGGKCEKVPTFCTREYSPVCTCLGKTYPNSCSAYVAKEEIDHFGPCVGDSRSMKVR